MMNRDDRAAHARLAAARDWDGSGWLTQVPENVASLVPSPCEDPLVSVVTPCHDDGGFLLDALASVRVCADERLEMIVIDDASTDPLTCAVLTAIAEVGVTVMSTPGLGPAGARNAGVAVAKASAILPLDADNLLRPGFVPQALDVLAADASVAAVHADVSRFGLVREVVPAPTPSVAELLSGNKLDTCAVIRRDALIGVGGWDEGVLASEDWALWLAFVDAGWRFATVEGIGSDYRVREGSLSSILTPAVRHEHFAHLVERHRDLYAVHVDEVLTNFSAALATLQERDDRDFATSVTDAATADRVAELRAERDELRALLESANRRAEAAVSACERGTEQLRAAEVDAARLQAHIDALEATKLFTWAKVPRRIYGRLRDSESDALREDPERER